jgi:hypothetical protein
MKETAKYYKDNPKAKAKKDAYQKEYNKKPEQVKKRVELNKVNRDRGTYGNGDGKDYDHATKKMVKQSVNRGRNSKNGGTKGDIRARK